jgi:hypothetical protein
MATVKISELPAILGANTATTDVLPIVDVSGNITNKITREEFFSNIGNMSGVGTITGATTLSLLTTTTSALSLDSGTTGAINIGTNANAKTITIGNSTGATSIVLNSGTGAINIGTNAIARTITIGNTTGASALTLEAGTGALNIGTGAFAKTITIGNGTGATSVVLNAGTGPINIGTNAIARTTTIGNATGASAVAINSGTGNIILNGANANNVGIGTTSPRSKADVAGTLTVGDANPPVIDLSRNVVLANNSGAGSVNFGGRYDATNYADGAQIGALAVGAWSSTNYGTNLLFSTVASSSTTLTERMRITSAGDVGIGTSVPAAKLDVIGDIFGTRNLELGVVGVDATCYLSQYRSNVETIWGPLTTRALFGTASNHDLAIQTNNTERMRIDSTGRLLLGDTTARATLNGTGTSALTPNIQQLGGDENSSSIGLFNYSATTSSDPAVVFNKSLNATIGSHTAVTSGTQLGGIGFNGSDGTAFAGGAYVQSVVDGTVASGSVPGRLMFGTTAVGGTAPTERMRIDSAGNVGIGTASPTGNLTIGGSSPRLDFLETGGSAGFDNTTLIRDADVFVIQTRNGSTFVSNDYRMTTNASGALTHEWRTGNTERMRIVETGNVGIGSTAPVVSLHVVGDTMTTGVVYKNQPAQASKAAAATLTIAELENGIIQYTGAAATLTLPTGTNIETGTPNTFPVDMSFDFSVINTGTGTVTLGTATGLTLVGAMTTAISTSTMFRVRKTATNAYTVYRIS